MHAVQLEKLFSHQYLKDETVLTKDIQILEKTAFGSVKSTMSKNRQLFWRYFATSVFFCILSTATPEALDSDALQQMGLLLGLPMGRKDASLHENIPKFVMDIHDCWNSNQSDDCLPGYPGTDVNQLRASLGTSGKCFSFVVACTVATSFWKKLLYNLIVCLQKTNQLFQLCILSTKTENS